MIADLLGRVPLFALVLTFGTFQIGLWCQKKTGSNLCNPLLISVVLTIAILLLTGYPNGDYQAGMTGLSWLLTPATVCLALPLYRQVKILGKNLPAIIAGIAAGTVVSLGSIFLLCRLFCLDSSVTVSLLPKSITTAIGMVLAGENGGIEALTTAVIVATGILGSLTGSVLCKILKIHHPIAQGVALGTASHVIGTSRANELGSLQGAVSSLSLTVAGILTVVLFPLVLRFV